MSEELFKQIAGQLRKPEGEMAREVGVRMNEANNLMNLETINSLQVETNDHLLEIGMGNGYFVRDILSKNESVVYHGCDFSVEMVKASEELNTDWINQKRAAFVQADASALPYPDVYFNKVFTVNTIYFWDNPAKVFSEIKRVLAPGGTLIIALRPKHIMDAFPFTQYGFNTFSEDDIKSAITTNGFKLIDMINKKEPDLDFWGEPLKNEFWVVIASKQ